MPNESLSQARHETPSEKVKKDPVTTEQERTRDKVFRIVGDTAELGSDTLQATTEIATYNGGRTVRTIGLGFKRLYEGITGKPYKSSSKKAA